MSNSSFGPRRNVLALSAIVEVGTGVILMIDPLIAGRLLLGEEISGVATLLGRCFGIALLALGLACWPGDPRAESGSPALRGMSIYNALIALYLGYLGTVRHASGLLLWPAVLLHAVVAVLLVRNWRSEHASAASPQ